MSTPFQVGSRLNWAIQNVQKNRATKPKAYGYHIKVHGRISNLKVSWVESYIFRSKAHNITDKVIPTLSMYSFIARTIREKCYLQAIRVCHVFNQVCETKDTRNRDMLISHDVSRENIKPSNKLVSGR